MSGAWGDTQANGPAILKSHGVLTPVGDSSLNIGSGPLQDGRKRKRSGGNDQGDIGEPFVLRPHPSSPSDRPLLLTPRMALSRSFLPLSCPDPTSSSSAFPTTRFFSTASLPSLEAPLHEGQRPGVPTVLIAELEDHGSLYAVERVQRCVYALCKLGDWMKVDDLWKSASRSLECNPRPALHRKSNSSSKSDWWSNAAVEVHDADHRGQLRGPPREHISGVKLCMKRPAGELSPRGHEPCEKSHSDDQHSEAMVKDRVVSDDKHATDTRELLPEDTYEMIRVQYQETLYISKTSLAYFAKGPLSRARAAFFGQTGSSAIISELIEFLRTIVMSIPSLDSKYREALPSLLSNLPAGDFSEEDLGQITVFLSGAGRKSKPRKKLGKNGLFPGEEAYLAKWWVSRALAVDDGESRDAELKRLLIEQRVRETELQMILILETLALEALEAGTLSNICPRANAAKDAGDSQPKKKKKQRKPQDLNTLLELLMDRLCIWQSMGHDEAKVSESSSNAEFQQSRKNAARKSKGSDRLRDFCIEVVVPFYGARLPELSANICQKLGGPTIPSPVRKPLAKTASAPQMLHRPGAAIQRPQMRKPRKVLERVLTDQAHTPRRPQPSLLRSATDSMVPGLKREISDKSMSTIPVDRGGIQKSKRFSQREVDLSAVSQATEAKLRKKANLEQELKGAIAALKKPNPRLAVKELVESAERRAAGSASHARKSKPPVRNPFAQGVQVMATPKSNRRKDVFGGLPRLPRPSLSEPEELEVVPPSSDPRVSSSSLRPPAVPAFPINDLRVQQSTGNPSRPMIEQTPTHRPPEIGRLSSISHGLGPEDGELCRSSPELPSFKAPPPAFNSPGPSAQGTPSYSSPASPETHQKIPSRRVAPVFVDVGCGHGILETPVKASKIIDVHSGVGSQQPPLELEPVNASKSIYESLGWDDDVDELM